MTEKRGFFDNLKHQLGGSPAPDDVVKAKDPKDPAPKDPAKDAPKDAPKDIPKNTSKDTPKDTPKDSNPKDPKESNPKPATKDPKEPKKDPAKDPAKDSKTKKSKLLDDEDDRLNLDLLRSLLDAADEDDPDDDADDDDATDGSGSDETMSSGVGNVSATINPLKPILKQEGRKTMRMRDRDFYDRIGDLAYYHDRGDELDYSELDAYMKEYKTESLSEVDLIKEIDACLEADYSRFSAVLLDRIANAEAHRPDPVKRLFINKIDKRDTAEYETFEKAAESVKGNPYVTDPKAIFEQVWRQVNPDGTLGARVSEQEVRRYADTLNAKNKGAFLTRMGLEQKTVQQGNQNQQKAYSKPNQGDGKKGNKPGKPNKPSDNSSGAPTSGAGN